MSLNIVILAAGQGKRMYSNTPKVLHKIAGKPMLMHVIETAMRLNPTAIYVVIGHGGEQIKNELSTLPIHWVVQTEQLGTGHAVLQALPYIDKTDQVLVLSGDVPLIETETLRKLVNLSPQSVNLLTASLDNPFGLGRIVRNSTQQIEAIIEEKDASEQQRLINEIYSGICCVNAADLKQWLPKLSIANAQGEYYLTEIIAMAVSENRTIDSIQAVAPIEILGVNNRAQLQTVERLKQEQLATELMLAGTSLADAARIDIRGELHCEKDVFIDINTIFNGKVIIGEGSIIGPNCQLTNVIIGSNCEIMANSVLEQCEIGDACQIGPFARIRPGTHLANQCKIGNFVEVKNSSFGENSKANHLSYLGDATIGSNVNIGAGTITCNYDGANKHQTIIENGVHIGSDTQLIAPITVGENATIGAGSTLRHDVPRAELTLTVSTQKTIYGWKRPIKKDKDHAQS